MYDFRAIAIIDHFTLFHEIKLVDNRIVAFPDRPTVEAVLVPGSHFHHVLDLSRVRAGYRSS